jgi:hypothetical protein
MAARTLGAHGHFLSPPARARTGSVCQSVRCASLRRRTDQRQLREANVGIESDLLAIIARNASCPAAVIMPMFRQLAPITIEDMIGTWRGGKFDGGKEPDPIRWYGKRFVSRDHAEPLLCRAEDGSVYTYTKLGSARLREAAIFGVTSGCLIYDQQPIMDYFRKLTNDVLLGLGDVKGRPLDFFFHLTRE